MQYTQPKETEVKPVIKEVKPASYEVVEVTVSEKSRWYDFHKTWFKWKNTETGELSIQAYTTREAAERMLNKKIVRDSVNPVISFNSVDGLEKLREILKSGKGGTLDLIWGPDLEFKQDKVGV